MGNTTKTNHQELNWEESISILERLPGMAMEERRAAVEKLFRNPSQGIRQRALSIGAAVLSDESLVNFIRNEADDILRNAGLEILKLKGRHSFSLVLKLLKDSDPDVVLQAILVIDHLTDPRAFNSLRTLLKHENPNIVQAVITAIGHLGDARAVQELLQFLKAEPWLQMAAIQALGDIRSSMAVKPLKGLLPDFLLGPFVAEALARIGGSQAFLALAEHWVAFHTGLEAEPMLGFLAHVLEGLSKKPAPVPALTETFSLYLEDNNEQVRAAAARCILVLGQNKDDADAIQVLAESQNNSAELPSCLIHRKDLIPLLLNMKGVPYIWGLQLAARYPKNAPIPDIISSLHDQEILEYFDILLTSLQKIRDPLLAPALLKLYLRLPFSLRNRIMPLLTFYKKQLNSNSELWTDIDKKTYLVLAAFLGWDEKTIVDDIMKLPQEDQVFVMSHISGQKAVCKKIPWKKWLDKAPATYGPAAAQAAVNSRLHELLPVLREVLKSNVLPKIIRAFGELEDKESVPILVNHFQQAQPFIRVLIIENLGRIGGPEARRALQDIIGRAEGKEVSLAYRALSHCAIEDDIAFFQKAIVHPDWIVRLACAEVLGRFHKSENLDVLTRLTADPVSAVAQRAMSFLEPEK
jgi:HEAT repeat protein